METKVYTTSRLATKLGVDTSAAYNLLHFLVSTKLATNIGPAPRDPAVKKKGKGENRYQLADDAVAQVAALLQKVTA